MGKKIGAGIVIVLLVLTGGGIVAALAGGRSWGPHFGPGTIEVIDRTLAVSGAPTLELDTDNGAITVTRGDTNAVVIHATKHGNTETLQQINVQIAQEGDRVTVHTVIPNGFFDWGGRGVEYEVRLPARTVRAQLRTSNGTISVSGIAGQFDLGTSNGRIAVRDFDGEIRASTSNGTVALTNGSGTITVHTNNGTIEMQDVRASGMNAESSNGRIGFAGTLASGSTATLKTSNGAINVFLPSNSAFALDATTSNSSITIGFPVTGNATNDKNSVRGVIVRPDATLNAHTSNGSISITTQEG